MATDDNNANPCSTSFSVELYIFLWRTHPAKNGGTGLKCYRVPLKRPLSHQKTLFTLKISYAFFSFTSSNPLWPLYVEAIALYTQLLYLRQLNVTPYNNGASSFTPPFYWKVRLSVCRPHSYLFVSLSSMHSSTEALKRDRHTHTHFLALSLSLRCRLVNNTGQSEYRCCWKQPIGSGNVDRPQPKMNEDHGSRGWILWRTAGWACWGSPELRQTNGNFGIFLLCFQLQLSRAFSLLLIPVSLPSLRRTPHVQYLAISCLLSCTRNLRA